MRPWAELQKKWVQSDGSNAARNTVLAEWTAHAFKNKSDVDLKLALENRYSNDIVGVHSSAYISSCRNGDRTLPADYKGRTGCAWEDVEEATRWIFLVLILIS